MTSRVRLVILVGILFFVFHALATTAAVERANSLSTDAPLESEVGPYFAAAILTFPLYPFLRSMPLFAVAALNSALCALVAAFLIVRYRWRGAALLIALPLLLIVAAALYGIVARSRVERGLHDLASAAIQAPQSENDAARRIDPFVARLGVNDPLWHNSLLWVDEYLTRQVAHGDDAIDALPQPVDHYLVAHRWDIDDLLRALDGPPPRWPARRYDSASFYRIQKVLLTDALQRAAAGDHAGAWQRVAAAQRLSDAAFLLPRLTTVSYAIWETEDQLGVVRKLQPAGHIALTHFDPHQRLIDAIASQTASFFAVSVPWYARPYFLLCSAESGRSGLREALRLQRERDRVFDVPPHAPPKTRVPFNPMGILSGGALSVHANRMLLDVEGTERLLAAKKGDAVMAGSRTPDRKWLFDGTTLRLEPPLPARIPALPTVHRINANPAARTPSG